MTGNCEKKKHLALFVPSLRGGGAEKVTVNLANAFAKKGLKVDLLLAQAEGVYLKAVEPMVRVVDLRAKRVVYALRPLAQYLRQERPDGVITVLNHANVVGIASWLLAGRPCQIVVTEHNSVSHSKTNSVRARLVKTLMPVLYNFATHVVAVSKGVASDLASMGVKKKKLHTIYNPIVDAEVLEQALKDCPDPWFKEKDTPIVLAVGRLEPQKDLILLIQAFHLLAKQCNAKLVILGDGPMKAQIESTVVGLNLADRVKLLGFVENPFAFMSRASVLVLSSRWEGFANVLVEAMACGSPVVATDCPSGPSEILENGKWGRLVPVGDVNQLSEAIKATLKDGRSVDVRKRASEFGVQDAVESYISLVFPKTKDQQI